MLSSVDMWAKSAFDSDRIESLNYDQQTLEQEITLAGVVRRLRNVHYKVAEKLETSVIDQSQSFSGNWYETITALFIII